MSKTKIEWADEVWNPVTGCTKVSPGCAHCYAERLAGRFWGERKFTEVRTHEDRFGDPTRWKKPRRVFVNSMSDLFHPDVRIYHIANIFAVMALAKQHTFMVLTKRAKRMHEVLTGERFADEYAECIHILTEGSWSGVFDPLPNVWLGVSTETQKEADARIPFLLETPAAVRFVSVEPMLGPVDLWKFAQCEETFGSLYDHRGSYDFYKEMGYPDGKMKIVDGLDWVICGGESGPGARPMHPDWARGMRDQCQAAGVPFFFKQWGEWAPGYPQYGDTDAVVRFEDLSEVDNVTARDEICLENTGAEAVIMGDGNPVTFWQPRPNRNPWWMLRVGKKAAGRELDGRTWEERPGE